RRTRPVAVGSVKAPLIAGRHAAGRWGRRVQPPLWPPRPCPPRRPLRRFGGGGLRRRRAAVAPAFARPACPRLLGARPSAGKGVAPPGPSAPLRPTLLGRSGTARGVGETTSSTLATHVVDTNSLRLVFPDIAPQFGHLGRAFQEPQQH